MPKKEEIKEAEKPLEETEEAAEEEIEKEAEEVEEKGTIFITAESTSGIGSKSFLLT